MLRLKKGAVCASVAVCALVFVGCQSMQQSCCQPDGCCCQPQCVSFDPIQAFQNLVTKPCFGHRGPMMGCQCCTVRSTCCCPCCEMPSSGCESHCGCGASCGGSPVLGGGAEIPYGTPHDPPTPPYHPEVIAPPIPVEPTAPQPPSADRLKPVRAPYVTFERTDEERRDRDVVPGPALRAPLTSATLRASAWRRR